MFFFIPLVRPFNDGYCDLVEQAIEAGIFNDLGSGSNVDVCVITKDNVEYLRNYGKPNERGQIEQKYSYPRGTTRVLSSSVQHFTVTEEDAMDLS
jgi:20S proteasome subunit beta 2